jgi:hypothetical protein
MTTSQPPPESDWLDDALTHAIAHDQARVQHDGDQGFTARVMTTLPSRERVRATRAAVLGSSMLLSGLVAWLVVPGDVVTFFRAGMSSAASSTWASTLGALPHTIPVLWIAAALLAMVSVGVAVRAR